jgi:dTDP-4-dehydrorhamnose reductase
VRVLVTGGAGQLARALARLAMASGLDVHAPDRSRLDITDLVAVRSAVAELRPRAVVNCAAYNDVDGAEEDWRTAYRVNAMGPRNLAHACRETGAALVHVSTDYVFDGAAGRPYTLADEPRPLSAYGRSKLLGERFVRDHLDRFYIVRTSWVFGDGRYSFPRKVLAWASERDELRIDSEQVSCPTYAPDLARAVLDLLATDNFGLYHATNRGGATRHEWAQSILEATGWRGRLVAAPPGEFALPAARPRYSVLDPFPLEDVLGRGMPHWREATERFLRERA